MENAALSQDDFDGPEPDATGTGWVRPAGTDPVDAIFVLAGRQLGIGRVGRVTPPVWLKLDELVNLDAIGEPDDGVQQVEITMEDHQVVAAGWKLSFCDAVVATLQRIAGVEDPAPPAGPAPSAPTEGVTPSAEPAVDSAAPVTDAAPITDAAPVTAAPVVAEAPADPAVEPAAAAPAEQPLAAVSPSAGTAGTDPSAAGEGERRTLELEDVVYLGGHPDHTKKRKRCLVTLDGDHLELTGPNDLLLVVPWSTVHTIAVQNADEARFRTNTKIHRDASALILECDASVTVLLEARECPTIALRTAITQLLDDTSVSVI